MADQIKVTDIPIAPSGYDFGGKTLMVHDAAAPEPASTKLVQASRVLAEAHLRVAPSEKVPVAGKTTVHVEAFYADVAGRWARVRFVAHRGEGGGVTVAVREIEFNELKDVTVNAAPDGYSIDLEAQSGGAVPDGSIRLSQINNPH